MAACVVILRLALNERLSVTGGYTDVAHTLGRRSVRFGWKGWFGLGLVAGGLLFVLIGGSAVRFDGYGWLTRTFTGGGRPLVGLLLLAAGTLIGYGAKTATGCTSGNGLSGSSLASPASLVATGTFMATAIAASFVIKALI